MGEYTYTEQMEVVVTQSPAEQGRWRALPQVVPSPGVPGRWRVGVALSICSLILLAAAAPASAQAVVTPPQQITVRNEVTVSAPPPDPQAIADAAVQSGEAVITTIIAPPPLQWANEFLGLPDIWRTTPPELSYNNGGLRPLAEGIRLIALAILGILIFVAGAGYALGQSVSPGRIAFAVVLSQGNVAFWQIGIDLNNAINNSLAAPDVPTMLRAHLVTHIDPGTAIGTVILVLVYALVALALLFSLLFRLGMIDILFVIGSLALIFYAISETDWIGNLYTRLSVGLVFGQVLIVIGLRAAGVLAGLGTGGTLGTLLSIVILLLVRGLPNMLANGGTNSRGSRATRVAWVLVRRRVGL